MLTKTKGFTLIELLVVIAIIGLLAAIVLVAFNQARMRARDTRRLADMHQFASALALYYDKYGYYPRYDANAPLTCPSDMASFYQSRMPCWTDLQTRLSPYMVLPNDPVYKGTARDYTYVTMKSGQGYELRMYLEIIPDIGNGCNGVQWCSGINWN